MPSDSATTNQFEDDRDEVSFVEQSPHDVSHISANVTHSPDRSINICAKLFPESPIQLGDGTVHSVSVLTGTDQCPPAQETSIYFDNSEILSESKDYCDVSRIGGHLLNSSLPGLPMPTVPYASPLGSPIGSPASHRFFVSHAAPVAVQYTQGSMPNPPYSPLPTLPVPRVTPDANSLSAPNSPMNSPSASPAPLPRGQAPMSPRLQVLNSPVFKYPTGEKSARSLTQDEATTHTTTPAPVAAAAQTVPMAAVSTHQTRMAPKHDSTAASATGFIPARNHTVGTPATHTSLPTSSSSSSSPASPVALVRAAIDRIAGPLIGSPAAKPRQHKQAVHATTPPAVSATSVAPINSLGGDAEARMQSSPSPSLSPAYSSSPHSQAQCQVPGSPYQCAASPIRGSTGVLPSTSHAFTSTPMSAAGNYSSGMYSPDTEFRNYGLPASPPSLAPLTLPPSPPSPYSPLDTSASSLTVAGIPFTLHNNTDPSSAAPALAPPSPPTYRLDQHAQAQTTSPAAHMHAQAQAQVYAHAYAQAFDAHMHAHTHASAGMAAAIDTGVYSQDANRPPASISAVSQTLDASFAYGLADQSQPNYGVLDFSTDLPAPTVTPIRSPHGSHGHCLSPLSPNTTRTMPQTPLSPISALPALPLPTIESNGLGSPQPHPYLHTRVALPPTPVRQKLFSPMNHTPTHAQTHNHNQAHAQAHAHAHAYAQAQLQAYGAALDNAGTGVGGYPVHTFPSPFAQLSMRPQQQQQQQRQVPVSIIPQSSPFGNNIPGNSSGFSQPPSSSPSPSSASSLKASKWLGLIVSIGSLLSKAPQVIEVFRHRSVRGLSLPMFAMELATQAIATYYHLMNDLPFHTYGENISLAIGNIAVLVAFVLYKPSSRLPALAALVISGLLAATIKMPKLLMGLQLVRIPTYCLSRVPQIMALYTSKDPAHLNPTSFAVNLMGSITRLFTSAAQSQHDPLILSGFWSSIGLNALVLGLIFYYKRFQALQKVIST